MNEYKGRRKKHKHNSNEKEKRKSNEVMSHIKKLTLPYATLSTNDKPNPVRVKAPAITINPGTDCQGIFSLYF